MAATALTLLGELLIVRVGAIVAAPALVMEILRGVVQYGVPMCVALIAMRASGVSATRS